MMRLRDPIRDALLFRISPPERHGTECSCFSLPIYERTPRPPAYVPLLEFLILCMLLVSVRPE